MASKEVVVVDADVLIPVLACDFLLTGLDLAIYELAVSRFVVDEVERHLLADFPGQDPARLAVRAQQMRFALRNSIVRDAKPTEAVDTVNAKDRHVAMAAITSRATVAVTNDRPLRRQLTNALPKLSPMSIDQFALHLFQRDVDALDAILDTMAAKRTRPPMTVDELTARMAGAFPRFVTKWSKQR
jgi:rRNA-processing protein FCF1